MRKNRDGSKYVERDGEERTVEVDGRIGSCEETEDRIQIKKAKLSTY